MRFQLDPQGEAPERPPPAAPPRPAASAPALPAPVAPAAAPRASRKKAWLVVGVVALLVLAGGGLAAYVMKAGPFAYPDRYLLQKGEEPRGTRLGPVQAEAAALLGLKQNPGQMSAEKIDDLIARGGAAARPSDVWAEDISTSFLGEDVIVLAIKYSSESDAKNEVGSAVNGCNHRNLGGGGAVLRDGAIVVVIDALGTDAASAAKAIQKAIVAKTPDLSLACAF